MWHGQVLSNTVCSKTKEHASSFAMENWQNIFEIDESLFGRWTNYKGKKGILGAVECTASWLVVKNI